MRWSWAGTATALVLVLLMGTTACVPAGNDNGGDNGGGDSQGDGSGGGGEVPQPDNEPLPGSDAIPALFQEAQPLWGSVQLPEGFDSAPEGLRLFTTVGDARLNGDGSYNAELAVRSGTRTLCAVLDARDRIVLLGHLHPFDNMRNPVNTESTAIALLYFALGGWTTPQDTFDDIYSLIRYDYTDAVATVQAALDQALAEEPGALAEGDPRILAAVQEAQDVLLAQAASDAAKRFDPQSKSTRIRQQSIATGGFITTSPGPVTAQNGVFVRSDTASGGLFALNTAPRRGRILIYKTAYESGGQRTDLSPVELVGSPVTVPSAFTTGGTGGFFDSVTTQLEGGYVWRNIRGPVFSLDMHDGAHATHYDLLLLGSTLNNAAPSPLFQDPRYALEDDRWMTELADLQAETFYIDYLIPVAEIWAVGASILPEDAPDIPLIDESGVANPGGGSATIQGLPDATRTAMLAEARALCDPVIQGINLGTAQGYSDALAAVLARAGGDATFRANLTDILYRAYGPNNTAFLNFSRMQQSLHNMASTFALTAAVQYGLTKVSLGSVTEQLQASRDISVWSATVSAVRLTPSAPVVTEKYPIEVLSAQVRGADSAQLCYRWSTAGRIGTLVGSNPGDSGTMFTSSGSRCDYVADPGAISKTTNLDTVSVEVYDVTNSGGNANCDAHAASGVFVGSATVTIAGDERDDACVATNFNPDLYNLPGPLTLEVSPRTVLPGDTVTVTINYDFTAPGADRTSSASVNVYLPLGCGFCNNPERRCLCDQADRSTLTLDGQNSPANINTTEFVTGIGGDATDTGFFRPLRSTCLTGISPLYFSLPDPDVRETVTHVLEYRISPNFRPCPLDRPDCWCPQFIREPVFVSTGNVWSGPFVIALAGPFSGGLAVELLNVGVDPAYDPETSVFCPDENP